MLIALALALATAPQTTPADVAEVQCVYNDMVAQSETPNAQVDMEAAQVRCRAKYGWSHDEAETALLIAAEMVKYQEAAGAAVAAGLDAAYLDKVYSEMTQEEFDALSSSNKTAPESVLKALLEKLRKQTQDPVALQKGIEALNWHAVLDTAGAQFLKTRKKPS